MSGLVRINSPMLCVDKAVNNLHMRARGEYRIEGEAVHVSTSREHHHRGRAVEGVAGCDHFTSCKIVEIKLKSIKHGCIPG